MNRSRPWITRQRTNRSLSRFLLFTLLLLSPKARGDCPFEWKPGDGLPGLNGTVFATAVYDDGNGPALYVGGQFTVAGNAFANNIAKWDGSSWSALGSGVDYPLFPSITRVTALAVYNGNLIAGGTFTIAGGNSANYVAQWNGSTWSALGSGVGPQVLALIVYNGALVAGGDFTIAGGANANRIAQWNGSSWSALGSGVSSSVLALTTWDPDGAGPQPASLIAGGAFANKIAQWNGTSWSGLGSGITGTYVLALTVYEGNLIAGGDFTDAGGASANDVAQWNGSSWSALGNGISSTGVYALTVYNGALIAGGSFSGYIVQWNPGAPGQWSAVGTSVSSIVHTLTVYDGALIAGGQFTAAGGNPARKIAQWDGSGWSALGIGMDNAVYCLTEYNNELIAGGSFTTAGGASANRIARRSGSDWFPLGSGMDYLVLALSEYNGNLIAGGDFTTAGGISAGHIAQWNGSSWSPMGSGLNRVVYALTKWDPDGAGPQPELLIAGGDFFLGAGSFIAQWNGGSWNPLGGGMTGTSVRAVTVYNGALIAAGNFSSAGGGSANCIAQWNGANWSALGSGIGACMGCEQPIVHALTVYNGRLIAGGTFSTAGGNSVNNIAQWDGSTWSALDSGMNSYVYALTAYNGELFAGGAFTTNLNGIAQWNPGPPGQWSVLGSGLDNTVRNLTVFDGELIAGGDFITAGGNVSAYWARWGPALNGTHYIYVDASAIGANDGTSWANAYTNLHAALSAVSADCTEVWVADGTYYPDGGYKPTGGGRVAGNGDSYATFQLASGAALYGGFAGGETQLEQRNPAANLTILCGDLAGNDGPLFSGIEENSKHVVIGSGTDASAVLDGFTITAGYPGVNSNGRGSGLYNGPGSSPTVTNCTFIGNIAGGAMYNDYDSIPTVTNCTFKQNNADGMVNSSINPLSSIKVENCTFTGNRGSGMRNYGGTPRVTNCMFVNNASYAGGGLYNTGSTTVTNCTFIGNSAASGDGMGNPTGQGGGIYNSYRLTLTNCIVWGNIAHYEPQIFLAGANAAVTASHCDIQDGWPGMGNIDVDPLLTPDGRLRAGSPCFNTGTATGAPPKDIQGESRPSGTGMDMGSDEFIDTDADGLPDHWEARYFASTTTASPGTDSDGDGLTNLQEYEVYGSNPVALPIYACNNCDPLPDGSLAHPYGTIQAALNAAGDGDTVLVLAGTYSGAGNRSLDFRHKSIMVSSWNGTDASQAASATIDCGDSTSAQGFVIFPLFAALRGFTITNSVAVSPGVGGGLRLEALRPVLENCTITNSNAATDGGGIYCDVTSATFHNLAIGPGNTAPAGRADAGVIRYTDVNLPGNLTVAAGRLDVFSSLFHGPGGVSLAASATLLIKGDAANARATTLRTDVTGLGDIQIDAGRELRLEDGAVIDLSGNDPDAGCADPAESGNWGVITVDGVLFVRDATIQNTNVDVNLATLGGTTGIINNDIRLLETAAGYGGEFFVEGGSTIQCNHIVSFGDRYLDLDPEAENPNLNIGDNRIEVFITQGLNLAQGELLELRARDYDNAVSNGLSGAYELAGGPGYDDTWTLERLEVLPGAKVNLTNRQGFDFSTNGLPDSIYVKDLILGDEAILNTGLQRLYYQTLTMGTDAQIVDIPVLGFSLKIIAMEDQTEFGVRIRQRLRDPADSQLCQCDGVCVNNSPPQNVTTCKEGSIARITSDPIGIPPGAGGVMDMRTHAPNRQQATSVAAKGAFARAGEDEIVVAFDYLFVQSPGAELIVYLSDTPEAAPGGCTSNGTCDNDCCEVARVYVPPAGRDGAVVSLGGTGQFASFYGEFPRGNLNFTRGTYVELELRGADARVWIDDFDPRIRCSGCADLNGTGGPEGEDYLLLLASFGLDIDANIPTNPGYQENADCFDSVLGGDRYVDTGDLLAWDTFLDEDALNACGTGVRSEPLVRESFLEPRFGGFQSHVQFRGMDSPPEGPETLDLASLRQGQVGISGQQSLPPSDLLVAGKPNGAGLQDDYLYPVAADGGCPGGSPLPAASGAGTRGHGRLVPAPDGTLYQLHATGGVLPIDGGPALVASATNLTPTSDSSLRVTVGVNDFGGGEFLGLPIADAAFDPTDANVLYVVPVLVIPLTGIPPCDRYKAAAKLVLSGGNYTVERLYEVPAANRTPPCDFPPQLDQGEFREIEVSTDGSKVFIASARADNDNDWVLVFNESSGTFTSALIGEVPPEGIMPTGLTVAAPLAMLASRVGETSYLYLAAGVNGAPSETVGGQTVARTRLFRFDVSLGVVFAGALDISNPECVNPYDTLGCTSTLTALAENPNDGTLYALGFTSPRFNVDYPYNSPPFGGPNPNQIVIFTTPTLATIPPGATWSMTVPPAPPAAAAAVANPVTCADLALPISLARNAAGCGVAGDMDGDGDVQLDDWGDFAGCLAGPMGAIGAGCDCADVDADDDADLVDVAGFLNSLGP